MSLVRAERNSRVLGGYFSLLSTLALETDTLLLFFFCCPCMSIDFVQVKNEYSGRGIKLSGLAHAECEVPFSLACVVMQPLICKKLKVQWRVLEMDVRVFGCQ